MSLPEKLDALTKKNSKLEADLLEQKNVISELQTKLTKQEKKIEYLINFLKAQFGHQFEVVEDNEPGVFEMETCGEPLSEIEGPSDREKSRMNEDKGDGVSSVNAAVTIAGDDDFCLGVEGSVVSSLVEMETHPVDLVIRVRNINDIVDHSDQDYDIPSESETTNDRSGEELNGVEQVEVAFEAVEPVAGPSAEKRFACDWPDCGKRFNQKCNLNTHKRVHTGEKPFACDWPHCLKRYSQIGSLKCHKGSVHTGEKPFKCSYCALGFTCKESLEIHVREHTGERPFSCDLCEKSFKGKRDLNKHKRLHV